MAADDPKSTDEDLDHLVRTSGVDPTDNHDHTIDLALEAHDLPAAEQPAGVPDGAARDDELPPKQG